MRTGIEEIAKEREEQLRKHSRSIEADVIYNSKGELVMGARALMQQRPAIMNFPKNWDRQVVHRMACKNRKDRLIIAGALIAAEIDRINASDE